MIEYKVTVHNDGSILWCLNGKYHCEHGPAVVRGNHFKSWWIDNKRHRLDGPAVVRGDGLKEWWIDGEELTEAEFIEATQPCESMTVSQIEKELGKKIKIIAGK